MARTPAKVPSGEVYERIVDAALRLFTERGYFNTTVPDVARAAQVSVGSIYHHFKDKEDVARALYLDLIARMQQALTEIAGGHASAHDRCRAVMAMLFELTESDRDAMDFMLYAKHRDFLPSERPVCSSKPFETMRKFVQEGMARGEIRGMDVMVATSCLFGGAIRLITARLDGVLAEPLPAKLDEVWACAWRGIAA
ncbi:Possible Transcriptional Regulator, TetR family [Thiobacillus denitrificans ATCC 25259]|uniref:Possible Transcriptional Regulator, TetR family n=1 Tax=Thiobacillus denitrificans (strain ATCC 25259 / T1) TaxID=292415 RepID=Q3SHE9_THIDA|nr:TetR/AcrR family transcriptional regulator [Thiobacillus denitrificans]AAZ97937.1 Possible Transcriptional Regulator, TetR family [Thiobacillus denitrificans ATCC 25259]